MRPLPASFLEAAELAMAAIVPLSMCKGEFRDSARSSKIGILTDILTARVAEGGDEAEVERLFCRIQNVADTVECPYEKGGILVDIIQRIADADRPVEAGLLAEDIHDPERRAEAMAWLSFFHAKRGECVEASCYFAKARDAVARAESQDDSDEAFGAISWECMCAGKLEQAIEMAWQIKGGERRIESLVDLVDDCVERGDKGKARELLDSALAVARGLPTVGPFPQLIPNPCSFTIASLAPKYAKLDDREMAMQIAEAIPVERDRKRALAGIAGGPAPHPPVTCERALQLARKGDPAQALKLLRTTKGAPLHTNLFMETAALCGRLGHLEESIAVLRAVRTPNSRDWALRTIIELYLEAGQQGNALDTLTHLRDPAQLAIACLTCHASWPAPENLSDSDRGYLLRSLENCGCYME